MADSQWDTSVVIAAVEAEVADADTASAMICSDLCGGARGWRYHQLSDGSEFPA